MYIFLVGARCPIKPWGDCSCTADVSDKGKRYHEAKYGFPYDDYCHYGLFYSEKEDGSDFTFEGFLKGQGFTEDADEVWADAELICRLHVPEVYTFEKMWRGVKDDLEAIAKHFAEKFNVPYTLQEMDTHFGYIMEFGGFGLGILLLDSFGYEVFKD